MERLLGNTRRPDVSFYKNGRIDITARTARLIDLRAGDVVDVAIDGGEYYLYARVKADKAAGRHEAVCRATNSGPRCRNLRAYSRRLCDKVLKAAGTQGSARLPVGEPLDHPALGNALPIIIRLNLQC